jgi:hypothetical protein
MMARPLPKRELERLAAIAGMFGSHHAGERASAALLADRLVRGAGLRWHDVILAPVAMPAPSGRNSPNGRSSASFAEQIAFALRSAAINSWERGFLISIRERQSLSQKQLDCLERITRKVNASRRGAPT